MGIPGDNFRISRAVSNPFKPGKSALIIAREIAGFVCKASKASFPDSTLTRSMLLFNIKPARSLSSPSFSLAIKMVGFV